MLSCYEIGWEEIGGRALGSLSLLPVTPKRIMVSQPSPGIIFIVTCR